jgi:hypothetical protein
LTLPPSACTALIAASAVSMVDSAYPLIRKERKRATVCSAAGNGLSPTAAAKASNVNHQHQYSARVAGARDIRSKSRPVSSSTETSNVHAGRARVCSSSREREPPKVAAVPESGAARFQITSPPCVAARERLRLPPVPLTGSAAGADGRLPACQPGRPP